VSKFHGGNCEIVETFGGFQDEESYCDLQYVAILFLQRLRCFFLSNEPYRKSHRNRLTHGSVTFLS